MQVKKGLELMRKERDDKAASLAKGSAVSVNDASSAVEMHMPATASASTSPGDSRLDSDDEDGISVDSDDVLIHGKHMSRRALRQQIREEEEKFPWIYIGITFSELVGLIVLNLIKGGKGSSIANIECGTGVYWAVTAATFVYLIGCALFGMWFVKRKYERKVAANYKFVEGDIDFSGRTVYIYPAYGEQAREEGIWRGEEETKKGGRNNRKVGSSRSREGPGACASFYRPSSPPLPPSYLSFSAIVAGLLAGFLGIGGGMIIGPLLLQFGMIPMVRGERVLTEFPLFCAHCSNHPGSRSKNQCYSAFHRTGELAHLGVHDTVHVHQLDGAVFGPQPHSMGLRHRPLFGWDGRVPCWPASAHGVRQAHWQELAHCLYDCVYHHFCHRPSEHHRRVANQV